MDYTSTCEFHTIPLITNNFNSMKKLQILIAIFLVVLTSCGPSTKLVSSWSDKENTPKHYDKIGVAVLFHDNANRYITERAIVDNLKARGINAVATYDIFPFAGKMGEIMEAQGDNSPEAIRKVIVEKVTENNFDGFMIVTLADKRREERWVNDRSLYPGGMGYYGTPYAVPGTYYGYYYYSMAGIYNDGHYVDQITYFLECSLFDVASEKMLWRAHTKSVDVESMEKETERLADIVGYQLKNKKILE